MPMRPPEPGFDDHLGLMSRDFSGARLVVFHGVSGSGKSTSIARLLSDHPDFRGQACGHVTGPGIRWRGLCRREHLVAVDECYRLRDLFGLARLLRRGHRVLAASHLPIWTSALLGRIWPVVALRTDCDPAKIARYLDTCRVRFSRDRVLDFSSRFGASYLDVDRIMEFDGGRDFDRAYDRFIRCCRVETRREPAPEA